MQKGKKRGVVRVKTKQRGDKPNTQGNKIQKPRNDKAIPVPNLPALKMAASTAYKAPPQSPIASVAVGTKNFKDAQHAPKADDKASEQAVEYVEDEDEFDPYLFIRSLPQLTDAMKHRKSPLPKKRRSAPKITLAIDLDETLVHCSVIPLEKAELTFSVNFNGVDYEVYVRTRPHLKVFLEQVSEWFETVVFTASQKVYADKLLDILDPKGKFIGHRLFRDSCVCIDGNYLKDLHILGRDLQTVAILDNSIQAFGFQLNHGIPIESWFDNDSDSELLDLLPFLRKLKDVKDVRPLIKQTFHLQDYVDSLR